MDTNTIKMPFVSAHQLYERAAKAQPKNKVLTVAVVAQFFNEPLPALLESILLQKECRTELLVVNNGAVGFHKTNIAQQIIQNRIPGFGESSQLCDGTIIDNPFALPHSAVLSQIAAAAAGRFVLVLSQDDLFKGELSLAYLDSFIDGLNLVGGSGACGLLLPVAGGGEEEVCAGGMPLDVLIASPSNLAGLPVEDSLPTLRLALNDAARKTGKYLRLSEPLFVRAGLCSPERGLFSGQCTFAAGNRFLQWAALVKNAGEDAKALAEWEKKLNQTLLARVERTIGGYYDTNEAERCYITLLQALLWVVGQRTAGGSMAAFDAGMQLLADQAQSMTKETITIVFLAQEFSVWPSLEKVYECCANDERYDAKLVYVPFSKSGEVLPEDVAPYLRVGLPIAPYTETNLASLCPDVLVMVKAYDVMPPGFLGRDLARLADTLVYIPYHISLFGARFQADATQPGMDVFYSSQPVQTEAEYFVIDSPGLYGHTAANNLLSGGNLLRIGHPRMDIYSGGGEKAPLPEQWQEKLKGKTVFIYNSHHTVAHSTFFDYFEKLLAFFAAHKKLALIWRPHPLMKSRLFRWEKMTEEKWNELVEKANSYSNVICDETKEYRQAFLASHAMITDVSSLLVEYMFTGKPVLLLRREEDSPKRYREMFGEELLDSVELAGNMKEITGFINRVAKGIDKKQQKRTRYLETGFYGYGSCVSQALANTLYENLKSGFTKELKSLAPEGVFTNPFQ